MVVNITANTSEVDVSAVSVAGNIVEDLTDAAIENEQVCSYVYLEREKCYLCLHAGSSTVKRVDFRSR